MEVEENTLEERVSYSLSRLSFGSEQSVALFIVFIVLAELLLLIGRLQASLAVHSLALLGIVLSAIWVRDRNEVYSLQVLMLLPLVRLVNVSMPVSEIPMLIYINIYAPILLPLFFLIRHQGLSAGDLGVRLSSLGRYIALSLIVGLFIATGEYIVIGPTSLVPSLSMSGLVVLAFVIFLFVGLVEELIFRSLLQTRLEGLFGLNAGLVVTSMLFGVMHSGYGEPGEILLTSLAGLVLGYMFQKTRSLPLVTLTHAFANIYLFVFMPFLGPGLGLV